MADTEHAATDQAGNTTPPANLVCKFGSVEQ